MAYYLNNKALLEAIKSSKRSYCTKCTDHDWLYTSIATDLALVESPHEGLVVRMMTENHIPMLLKKDSRGLRQRRHPLPFPSFSHFRYTNSEWVEVVRSHWEGTITEGRFNIHTGKINTHLATLMILLVDRIAMKLNWRSYSYIDEMKAKALVDLTYGGLKFDESKGSNPFAYLSQCVHNSFTSSLNSEKKQAKIKEDLIVFVPGMKHTHTRMASLEIDNYNKRNSP